MSEDKNYNGWTNYATWRINLEIFSDSDHFAESYENVEDVHDLSNLLEEYVQEILEQEISGSNKNSLVLSYALSFVSEVNYYEIAEHIWEQIQENKEEETPETESEVQ